MAGAADSDVIFQFPQMGRVVKVSAIDPVSLIEVSIVGDPRMGEEALRRAALDKLLCRLRRDGSSG